MNLTHIVLSFSVNNTICSAGIRGKICTKMWSPAVAVLSLVAKYAVRSVSQPPIHVYPVLYVKNLQEILFGLTVLYI